MKNITKLLSIVIVGMGVSATSFANSPFSSSENFGGTVFDPIGARQCFYEIYCDRTTGEVGIDAKHVISEEFKSAVSPNGWSGFRFSNKKRF